MLYYIVAFFQVVFCIALVGLILLHSGKGGGLSSSLGGGMGGTFSGTTIMEKNLTRLTLIVLGLFALTNIALFFLARGLAAPRRAQTEGLARGGWGEPASPHRLYP